MKSIIILLFSIFIFACPQPLIVYEAKTFTESDVSIFRVDDNTISFKFSKAYMDFVFKHQEVLGESFDSYDWDNAIYSLDIYDDKNNKLFSIENKKYLEESTIPSVNSEDYNVTFKNIKFTISKNGETPKILELTYKGKNIIVNKQPQYTQTKNINGKTYNLTFVDDFNYNFNGLNYQSYNEYNAIKTDETKDKDAFEFNKNWRPENPEKAHKRRDGSWDIRGLETKNGCLNIKTLSAEGDSIFLGYGNTKKLSGFKDLLENNKMISVSCVSKDSWEKGYFEARLRVKAKGYHEQEINGPWYAFWLIGGGYEFDIMEFRQTRPYFDQTTHWTKFYSGSWDKNHNQAKGPDDYENEFWTLGMEINENGFTYYLNGKPTHQFTKTGQKTGTWKMFEENGAKKEALTEKTIEIKTDDLNFIPIDGEEGYNGLSVYFSSEVAYVGWAGILGASNEWKLPNWMEIDYIAIYDGQKFVK